VQALSNLQSQIQKVQAEIIDFVAIGENTTLLDNQIAYLETTMRGIA
jgi:hypothetical protein